MLITHPPPKMTSSRGLVLRKGAPPQFAAQQNAAMVGRTDKMGSQRCDQSIDRSRPGRAFSECIYTA